MKVTVVAVLVAAGALLGFSLRGQSTPEIMRDKLDRAQRLLEAVVLQDYPSVEEHAGELDRLAELQSWFVLPTPEYARHSREFRAAAQAVLSAGSDEDLDAAANSFATMFNKCVQCHQYMSRVREEAEAR